MKISKKHIDLAKEFGVVYVKRLYDYCKESPAKNSWVDFPGWSSKHVKATIYMYYKCWDKFSESQKDELKTIAEISAKEKAEELLKNEST